MIFGKIHTSYQSLKKKCDNEGIKLLTTPIEWFEILKNRGNKPPSELNVIIGYINCGHIRAKNIHNLKRRGCDECRLNTAIKTVMQKPLEYKNAKKIGIIRKLELLSSKTEFRITYEKAKKETKPTDLELKWRCLQCGNKFTARYSLIAHKKSEHISGCPECGELNNQLIAHKIAEYIFKNYLKQGNFLEIDFQLNKIFKKSDIPRILSHHNVHVDTYAVVKLQNRIIKLAIERQGKQHQNSDDGWKAYLGVSRGGGKYSNWISLIERDKEKVKLFEKFNLEDFYLIVISYTMKPEQMFQYILNSFKIQTGIIIKKKQIN